MADALKEMFNENFYHSFAKELALIDKNFHPTDFIKEATRNLASRSLNERLRHTSIVLHKHISNDFEKAIEHLLALATKLKPGYTSLVLPDFVSLYGHQHFEVSMNALKYFTQFGSSEFAIRAFLKSDFKKTIKVMEHWATDNNYHVRRLASEGSRPRLPWSFKLDEVLKNPSSTKNILETLKADDELYVRKSVANHLNDLSKEHSEYMLDILSTWDNTNPHTAWIIKHASRTLIKKGNVRALMLFDFEKNIKVEIQNFNLHKQQIKLGEQIAFSFDIISAKNKTQKLVVDYAIVYPKKSGSSSRKVFKLKELYLAPNDKITVSKKQLIKDFTTRKHHSGVHHIELLINGNGIATTHFKLKIND